MSVPHVSFVIATHRRIDALRCALRAVMLQAHSNWTALVIGDRCGDETAETIRALRDPRIRYYNLPHRFGEQSGPNSAGLHLAEGDYVSFLNHDDLLLSDHLSIALDCLAAQDGDFYIAKFANATKLERSHEGKVVPVFTEVLPRQDSLNVLTTADPWCFDPSSFWLIRTSYAKAVGPWRPAVTLWRTPLRDWLMRAWRQGGKFCFGERITGLRFWTQNLRKEGPLYANETPEHEYMLEMLESRSAGDIRSFVEEQLSRRGDTAQSVVDASAVVAGGRNLWMDYRSALVRGEQLLLSRLYLRFGLDAVGLIGRLLPRRRGGQLAWISLKRTGEPLPGQPSIREFLSAPERYRVY